MHPSKTELRRHFKHVLKTRSDTCDVRVNANLYAFLKDNQLLTSEQIIACTWPLQGEIDLRPLLRQLLTCGVTLALPQTPPKGEALIFRHFTGVDTLVRGRFHSFYPEGKICHPTIIIVPLLAYDDRGYRLGYGGGYYDRTFPHFPKALTIGYATQNQHMKELPTETWDKPLSYLATENNVLSFHSNEHHFQG